MAGIVVVRESPNVEGDEELRAAPKPSAPVVAPSSWNVGTFTAAQVAAAVKAAQGFFPYPTDPNLLPSFWAPPAKMPTVAEIDFGDIAQGNVKLSDLLSSNRTIKLDRLVWHIQNPGQRLNPNPFTTMPLVANSSKGLVIVDGHHSLGALLVLGVKKAPVWLLPTTPNSPNAAQ